jgi:hypothetical protein
MNYKTTLRIIVTGLLFGFSITDASAQVVQKIGQNSFTINPKAVLELESTTKGFLPPRMSASNQSAMGTSLPEGLVVFITDGSSPGLQIWKRNKWIVFVDTDALALKANVVDLTAETSRAQGAESTNATAIALNTLKKGVTDEQAAAIAANTLKKGVTDQQAAEIAVNTLKKGVTDQQVAEIAANTLKKGVTDEQVAAIAANTLKKGVTDEQVAAIAANTLKKGVTDQQAAEIAANTLKKGVTDQQAAEIAANTLKKGVTNEQVAEIAANTLKKGVTDEQVAAIVANTLKKGVTDQQAAEIAANTLKKGVTDQQAAEIAANTLKKGVTNEQVAEIAANTLKKGVTDEQVAAIAANTLKKGVTDQQAAEIAANTLKKGVTDEQAAAITANTAGILSKENSVNKSASITLASNSDIKFPTEKAVIDYVDIKISTISIAKHTIAYTALASDNTILCDTSNGPFELSLPPASGASGKVYVIRKTDSSNNELTFSALILVDGSTVTTLNYPKTLRVQSDGSAWYVID